MKTILTALAVLAAVLPAVTRAGTFDAAIGCRLKTSIGDISTAVYRCDLAAMLDAAPQLHESGLINPKLTPRDVITHRYALMGSLMTAGMMAAVHDFYADHRNVDHSVWTGAIVVADGTGTPQTRDAVHFEFSRAVYAGIDWSRFRQVDLPHTAIHFRFAPWFKDAIAAEGQPGEQ